MNDIRCIVYFNGELIKQAPSYLSFLWAGDFSKAKCDGAIINFVKLCLSLLMIYYVIFNDGNYYMKDI